MKVATLVGGGDLPADVKHLRTLGADKKASKPLSSLLRPDIWWELPAVPRPRTTTKPACNWRTTPGCFSPAGCFSWTLAVPVEAVPDRTVGKSTGHGWESICASLDRGIFTYEAGGLGTGPDLALTLRLGAVS